MPKSLALRVLIALILGGLLGAGLQAMQVTAATPAVEVIEALGALWLNALRMTIVPLVFALLVVGIASVTDAAATGKLALKALGLFAVILVVVSVYSILAHQAVFDLWPIDEQSAATLRATATPPDAEAARATGFTDFLKSLAPANPLKAAVEDAILPLVVFGAFFGFAVTRLSAELRDPILTLFRGLSETMLVIVRWVLWVAPIGVFGLSLSVGFRTGLGGAAAIFEYVVVVTAITATITLFMFALVAVTRAVPFGTFVRASGPVLAVAFSTQSSLASLPAMLERSKDVLGIPDRITGLILPLAVAVFRVTSPVANLGAALFVCAVYGVEPGLAQLAAAVVVAFAISISSVGLPGQVSFFASVAPICLALGAPIDLLPILLAVEVIPDIFRTLGNVSGDMAVTSILSKDQERSSEATEGSS